MLKDISFELPRGKALGVIGKNGAGKSTLLQILTGTLTPTTGEVFLRGKVAALLELGSGFNPEFSGRDNIYVNGAILGLTRSQINERFDDIVAFSELGDHIEQPVKTYSSGMFVRLAFSVQVCVNPDILIVDEALAVGDVFFQQKCHARMEKLLEQGTSILLVSHDTSAIRKYCDTSLLLEDGQNLFYGDVEVAVAKYLFQQNNRTKNIHTIPKISKDRIEESFNNKNNESQLSKDGVLSNDYRLLNEKFSTGTLISMWPEQSKHIDLTKNEIVGDEKCAFIKSVSVCNEAGEPQNHFVQGDWVYFFWEVELLRDFEVVIGGLVIFSSSNLPIFCRGVAPLSYEQMTVAQAGCVVKFCAAVKTDIAVGAYAIGLSVAEMRVDDFIRKEQLSNAEYIAATNNSTYIPKAFSLQIEEKINTSDLPFYGLADLPNFFEMTMRYRD
ncbi:MAG: ATP-binding cassette domain-containing protein [Chlorobium sp.]|nr:ATP-binding cassette domain-containing protein [Chlorobium sp.]